MESIFIGIGIIVLHLVIGIRLGMYIDKKLLIEEGYQLPTAKPKVDVELSDSDVEEMDTEMKGDRTFGVRLLDYLQTDYKDAGGFAQIWEEEYEYLCRRACEILKYRFENHPEDRWYYLNMVEGVATYEEFVTKWYNPQFVKYLKVIKAI